MEKETTLVELCKSVADKLLESINLLDILNDIADGEAKQGTILSILKNNIVTSFVEIEECRKKIYVE